MSAAISIFKLGVQNVVFPNEFDDDRQPDIAAEYGNTCIWKTDRERWNYKLHICDLRSRRAWVIWRQPEIATRTPKPEVFISGTMTNDIEIAMANLGFSTMASLKSVANWLLQRWQPEMATWLPKDYTAISFDDCICYIIIRNSRDGKPHIGHWNFYHLVVQEISIYAVLAATLLSPFVGHCHLVVYFFGSPCICRCEGRSWCGVRVDEEQFGDPCPGTSKYLQVTYECQTT